jgi:hypothetical protein
VEIRWSCSTRLIRILFRIMPCRHAVHAVRSASGPLQRVQRFALPMSPIGPEPFHTQPCGLRLWRCAPAGSHKTGPCLAQIFHRRRSRQVVIIPSPTASGLAWRGSWRGSANASATRRRRRRRCHLSPSAPSQETSIPRAAPVVRITEQSCDRWLAERSNDVPIVPQDGGRRLSLQASAG